MKKKHSAVKVDHLTLTYNKTIALWDLSFEVTQGQMMGIIGPNGAGKSSLLKALLGLVKPLSGKVLFYGQPFKKMGRKIAYVPQKGSIDWEFPITVFDVVLMGRYGHLKGLKWYRKADRLATYQTLKYLEMDHLKKRQISELSGGEQQRLFIARALMQEADLLLLDEPFAGVDKRTEKMIVHILQKLREKGKTLLVVHHDLSTVKDYFDSALILNTSLVACGDVEDTFTPHHLTQAFGQKNSLFEEAIRLSQQKTTGLL